MTKDKSIAILTIRDAARMTERERQGIAKWLRAHADQILKEGPRYSKRFTGRYLAR